MSTKKSAASASAPAKKTAAPKTAAKAPAKAAAAKAAEAKTPMKKEPAKVPAKRTPAQAPMKSTPALKQSSREAMLARVESVRMAQRNEGHFDCFGRAGEGYCDQGACSYHAECLSVSRLLHSL